MVDSSLQIITNPLITIAQNPFITEAQISMQANEGCDIYYTLDGSFPTLESKLYHDPFTITQSTVVKAFATSKGNASKTVMANVHQLPHPDWKVQLKSVYNKQYTAGGDNGLIDGLFGSIDWRKGSWQGYQSQDFEAIIDFTNTREIKNIAANFLQDSRSWILLPKTVSFEYSLDGKKYIPIAELKYEVVALDNNLLIKNFIKDFTPINARYLRIKAINYGKLPAGHQGAGGDAFIFIDEISVN
jgi:hypothetical protein